MPREDPWALIFETINKHSLIQPPVTQLGSYHSPVSKLSKILYCVSN